jgi:hypothetical protein
MQRARKCAAGNGGQSRQLRGNGALQLTLGPGSYAITNAATTGTTTWDGVFGNPADQLPSTSTAGFVDTLYLASTTTLDFFIDDYFVPDNGGGVALNLTSASSTSAPEPSTWALLAAGLAGLGFLRRRPRS